MDAIALRFFEMLMYVAKLLTTPRAHRSFNKNEIFLKKHCLCLVCDIILHTKCVSIYIINIYILITTSHWVIESVTILDLIKYLKILLRLKSSKL